MTNKLELKPYHNLNDVCPGCSQHTTGVHLVEVLGVYDGALYWECSHCTTKWHQFPKGHRLNDLAQAYADGEVKGYES